MRLGAPVCASPTTRRATRPGVAPSPLGSGRVRERFGRVSKERLGNSREEISGTFHFSIYIRILETMKRILLNFVMRVASINFREERIFEDFEVIPFDQREIRKKETMDK